MNKSKEILVLLSFIFIISGSILFPVIFSTNHEMAKEDKENYDSGKPDFYDLKISDYNPNIIGTGENFNITLQQSLLNNSIISFTNFTSSNSFTEASPTVNNFNSSFINMTIDSIIADNITSIVRDGATATSSPTVPPRVTSFRVDTDSWLLNITVDVYFTAGKTANVFLHKSTWNSGTSASIPSGSPIPLAATYPGANPNGPTIFSFADQFLNTTLTDNNTWFIGLNGTHAKAEWRYIADATDNSYAYNWSAGYNPEAVDYLLTVELGPVSTTPSPEQINLKINNTQVTGYGDGIGSGYWSNSSEFQDSSGNLDFEITSDWSATSLNITQVQINYTKTDLKAGANFDIPGSGQNVLWNVTRNGGFNYFDSRIINWSTITFTIPSSWGSIGAYNGGTSKIIDISAPVINGYKDVLVLGAGNGTYWYLNASSSNLLSSIDTYVGSNPTSVVNFTNIVHFNATFSAPLALNDGNINLSVYSPAAINNKLNYTHLNSSFGPASVISLGEWDVSDNVTQFGVFRVHVSWNNDTAAGFLEKLVTILGETELNITSPPDSSEYNLGDFFNITVYFNDTKQNLPISEAGIDMDVSGSAYSPTSTFDYGNGYYNITVNSSDPIFSSLGWFAIRANVSKQYYNNQSEIINIKIIDVIAPSITINSPSDNDLFNATAPLFDVRITDENLDEMWYFIEGSVLNRTFLVNITFNQTDWDGISNGTLTSITFYANDSAGNEASQSVSIYVDRLAPSITINLPSDNDIFNATAPVFDVSITDGNLDSMWYFIQGSSVNRTFSGNEAFNQTDWDGIANGTLTTITFYANDTLGNETSQSVSIYVDRLAPSITINSPSDNDIFNATAPVFDVSITDGNLDTMWYFIQGSSVNRTFSGNGAFNQTDWDGIANGTLTTITFYANDTLGNETSQSVSIYVDRLAPLITINSPSDNDIFNATAPVFDVSITDGNLDTMWYFIQGSSVNRTFSGNEGFNQTDWGAIANGSLTMITFYANDSLGNEASQSVSIYVDKLGPSITINLPSDNDIFNATAPVFDVSITDGNLDSM
ncbi:hypothetical protein LCGC14_1220450, partial [marine sediment metagenome]